MIKVCSSTIDTDGRHHLLPWKSESSYAFHLDRPTPIPCRATRVNVDVSMSINGKQMDEFRNVYDPRYIYATSFPFVDCFVLESDLIFHRSNCER